MSADFSLDTFALSCVAAYGPRAKRMVLDERSAPESEMHKLVAYKYEVLVARDRIPPRKVSRWDYDP